MSIPFFFISNQANHSTTDIQLDEDNSKHALQVLRMKKGDMLYLTDGEGMLLKSTIVNDHKKKCQVVISERKVLPKSGKQVSIAISLLKNSSRFEWLLEKCTEIGVSSIIPLLCERTERQKFRMDRMNSIIISALLQSQQAWMPILKEPVEFRDAIVHENANNKFIAHCLEENKKELADSLGGAGTSRLILIGPEGDFSPAEIEESIKNNFAAVALGKNRLRSETAAVVAASLMMQI